MKAPGELDLCKDDKLPEIFEITPSIFIGWSSRGFFVKSIDENDSRNLLAVARYRDLKEGKLYMLERLGDSFSGYAETEARVQTEDACQSIINGHVEGLEAFKGSDIVYEFDIQPPENIKRSLEWDFPIKPDALIMNGTKWLLLESKHTLDAKEVRHFNEKVRFCQMNIDAKWLHKHFRKPDTIIGAMCSISRPKPSIVIDKNMILLVRNGFKFMRHVLS